MRATRLVVALAVALSMPLSGCAPETSNLLELTGSVVNDTVTVATPPLDTPLAQVAAGVEASSSAVPSDSTPVPAPAPQHSGSAWILVTRPTVKTGDTVNAGESLALLDDRMLIVAVAAAEADLARAKADAVLVDSRASEIEESRSEVASKTLEIKETIADLENQRADVAARLEAAKRVLDNPPSTPTTPTPGVPTPAELVAQLTTALDRIDDGLETANEGLEELERAGEDITAIENTLSGVRAVVAALVDAREVGVELAQEQAARAIVISPVTGVVVSVAQAGDVLAAGAPLAVIRPEGPSRVETYLTAEQASRIAVGGQAFVSIDSIPGRAHSGHIAIISDEHGYVPTTFASKIIHLTRGFKVTVELDGGARLPAGTPADLSISVK